MFGSGGRWAGMAASLCQVAQGAVWGVGRTVAGHDDASVALSCMENSQRLVIPSVLAQCLRSIFCGVGDAEHQISAAQNEEA